MKIPLYILVLFILTTCTINGQIKNNTLQKLVEYKLIENKQIGDFEDLLKRNQNKSNSAYLHSLYQTEFKKITGHYYSELGMQINFGKEKPQPLLQAKINEELYLYLSKLRNCDLVTIKQFKDQSRKIENNDYVYILQLLQDLANQSAYEEWLSPDKLIKYGEKLLINNVISERSFDHLKRDINAERITSHYQLIDYCNNAVFFDLAKYSNDPSIYLEQLHKEVSNLLPELCFTDFKYKIEVDSAESFQDYTAYKAVISLKVRDKTYTQKSFISPENIGKSGDFLGKIDDQEFYKIFNKILADNQSPLRLHEIQPPYQYGQKKYQYFGIITLSKNQVPMFRKSDSYIQVSYEKFENSLTSAQIDTAIKEYQQIGLFDHLTTSQIEKAKEQVSEQENGNLNQVLAAFPGIIYIYDTELGNLKDPYAELIREYKRISHNQFNATEISDDFDTQNKKKVLVKFRIANKSYNKTLKIEGDWIDTDFFDFVRSVVTEEELNGQFYELYTGGQEASVIYLTKAQYDYLRSRKKIGFADKE
ncbi:hypothetical protein A1704_03765 [Chryseobacterium cucumeris]|uniref:hypothetical protein n=1 Tax=Chryseobacterium cucumeris TaxID=1813611 RepID=UPI00078762D4|nr:hypothetical protein [Chryseobacterium cucumeris]KYH07792.1 hypothetical protein A1704_03765 [Chryseobacterium cucumeris]